MASVVSLNVSDRKGVIKNPVNECIVIENHGIQGDAHAGKWHRQISLLGNESIDKMRNRGIENLDPGKFAENITTEGINLYTLPIGTNLSIGETLHEVTQIGKECHGGCEIKQTVGDCVMPREGIFTKVIKGGIIRVGDKIEIL